MKRRTILLLLALTVLLFTAQHIHAAAPEPPQCSLVINRNQVSMTVSRGPCTTSDFPVWCDAYVPQTIVQGQTIPCEMVIITATPAPSHCELCNAPLPLDARGQPRHKCVVVRGERNIPITLYACRECHHKWLHPAQPGQQMALLAA